MKDAKLKRGYNKKYKYRDGEYTINELLMMIDGYVPYDTLRKRIISRGVKYAMALGANDGREYKDPFEDIDEKWTSPIENCDDDYELKNRLNAWLESGMTQQEIIIKHRYALSTITA